MIHGDMEPGKEAEDGRTFGEVVEDTREIFQRAMIRWLEGSGA